MLFYLINNQGDALQSDKRRNCFIVVIDAFEVF